MIVLGIPTLCVCIGCLFGRLVGWEIALHAGACIGGAFPLSLFFVLRSRSCFFFDAYVPQVAVLVLLGYPCGIFFAGPRLGLRHCIPREVYIAGLFRAGVLLFSSSAAAQGCLRAGLYGLFTETLPYLGSV